MDLRYRIAVIAFGRDALNWVAPLTDLRLLDAFLLLAVAPTPAPPISPGPSPLPLWAFFL